MTDDDLDTPDDIFCPPKIPTLVGCLHCQEIYESYLIEWRIHTAADGRRHGFWSCPTPDCDGVGFGCDILPVDRDWVDEDGERMWCEDEEVEECTEWDNDVDDRPPDAETRDDPPPDEQIPF